MYRFENVLNKIEICRKCGGRGRMTVSTGRCLDSFDCPLCEGSGREQVRIVYEPWRPKE